MVQEQSVELEESQDRPLAWWFSYKTKNDDTFLATIVEMNYNDFAVRIHLFRQDGDDPIWDTDGDDEYIRCFFSSYDAAEALVRATFARVIGGK